MRATRGDHAAFVNDAIHSASADCIVWPYGKISSGYGQMYVDGRPQLVHRLVLTAVVGDPPEGKPYALHDPKCESRACVNPAHLRWGNNSDNMLDKRASGTMVTGERHPRCTISDAQVAEIRRLYGSYEWTQEALARRFDTTQQQISRLVNHRQRSTNGGKLKCD